MPTSCPDPRTPEQRQDGGEEEEEKEEEKRRREKQCSKLIVNSKAGACVINS